MNKLVVITDAINEEPYAVVAYNDTQIKSYAVSDSSHDWVQWANSSPKTISDIRESLDYTLQAEFPRPATEVELLHIEDILSAEDFNEVKSAFGESTLELVDAVHGHGRRFASKSFASNSDEILPLPIRSFKPESRQAIIEYKALSYRSENRFSATSFEAKGARALWDPNLGPSGGWRCPEGSQFGGYITDRFGRGCGGGVLRRVGRALVGAGRRLDNIGESRNRRRAERVANRAQQAAGVGRVQRGGARAANAAERVAQRLVGDFKPGDGGRVGRRNIRSPREGLDPERESVITARLGDIATELDDLVDEPPTPEIEKRIRELTQENRSLRKERDGMSPKRIANVSPAPKRRRVVADEAKRPMRAQGKTPVKKPVAERRRGGAGALGALERAAQRLVGDYEPSEYKPGDKQRIKDRENRYAKVSDGALLNALNLNKPGKGRRDVEANKRQERLEILQEMLNRGIDIPEQYKKEVKQYRLKPQRKRNALGKRGRAAVALERAARRIEWADKPKNRDRDLPNRVPEGARPRPQRRDDDSSQLPSILKPKKPSEMSDRELYDIVQAGPPKPGYGGRNIGGDDRYDDAWDELRSRGFSRAELLGEKPFVPRDKESRDQLIERLRNNKPSVSSTTEWAEYNDYLDSVPDGDLILPGRDPQLEQPLSFDEWMRDVRPNMSTRSRARNAVQELNASTPIRRPQPKRQRGDAIDVNGMEPEQRKRLRDILSNEKSTLDDEWRSRLGLKDDEPVTPRAIKDYIKKQEDSGKPGAFIGMLKARANDWDVLDEHQKNVAGIRSGADMPNGDENELLNRIGPKRRKEILDDFNANAPAPKSRSKKPTTAQRVATPKARSLKTADKNKIDGVERFQRQYSSRSQAESVAKRYAKRDDKAYVVHLDNETNKWRIVGAESLDDILDDINNDSAARAYIGSAVYITPSMAPATKPESSAMDLGEVGRVSRSIERSAESIGGSIPDSRSKRNVRNRFPNNGLPGKAFWRDDNWKPKTGKDDREKHEKRFGRYYDADGNINARGRLVNDLIKADKDSQQASVRVASPAKTPLPDSQRPEFIAGMNRVDPLWDDIRNRALIAIEAENIDDLDKALATLDNDLRFLNGALERVESESEALQYRGMIRRQEREREIFLDARKKLADKLSQNRRNNANPAPATRTPAPRTPTPSPRTPTPSPRAQTPAPQASTTGRIFRAENGGVINVKGPRGQDIDKDSYFEAVERLHGEQRGSLDDVKDDIFVAAVFDEHIRDMSGRELEDEYDNPLTFESIMYGEHLLTEGDKFQNSRFYFTAIKGNQGDGFGGVWSVFKVEDKDTGETWFMKASTHAQNDALLEKLGADALANLDIAVKPGERDVRIGQKIVVAKEGERVIRWTAMRNVKDWELNEMKGTQFADANGNVNGRIVDASDMAQLIAFDFITDQMDRHPGNYMVAQDGTGRQRIAIIDNGLGFGGRLHEMSGDFEYEKTEQDIIDYADGRAKLKPRQFAKADQNLMKNPAAAQWGNNIIQWLPLEFRRRVRDDQQTRDAFRETVIKTAEKMKADIDRIYDIDRLEASGIALTDLEKVHIQQAKRVAQARIDTILKNPDDLVNAVTAKHYRAGFFGIGQWVNY